MTSVRVHMTSVRVEMTSRRDNVTSVGVVVGSGECT